MSPSPPSATPARHRVARVGLGGAGLGITGVLADGTPGWAILRVVVLWLVVAGLAVAVARARPGRAAVADVGAALVAISIGAAISIPRLVSASLGIRGISGLVAVTGGLAVLGAGLALVWRTVRGLRRLLVYAAVPVAAYALCLPIVIAVAATNVPRHEVGRNTPADHGLVSSEVAFRTPDGVRLAGWYLPSQNRAAVVLLHGASSTRSNVLRQAAVLNRHGYGVLLFDARGAGRSAGRAMNLGWYGDDDIIGALDFLAERPDVDPTRIGALGESMGGEEAIGAMAKDARVRAVVAEGATSRVAEDLIWLSDEYGVRGWIQRGVNRLTYGLTDLLTDAEPPLALRRAAAAAAPRPVLLITAGNVAEEAIAARHIRGASPGSVTVWTVSGADHTGGLATAPRSWERRVTAFFDRALLGRDRVAGG